jgi:hypothetical protein
MIQRVNVLTCTPRRDGLHLITYRHGGCLYSALSDQPVKPGTDVRVRDGQVIA